MSYTYNASDLRKPSQLADYSQEFREIERDIFEKWDLSGESSINRINLANKDVEKACIRWACITSKTQRRFNDRWQLKVYENLCEFKPIYENLSFQSPPSRENEPISEFSEKSRKRLMKRFKRMRKGELDLPFFVTLTYQKNQRDTVEAKKHLNTFLQRFRRLDRESYKVLNPKTGRMNTKYRRLNDFKYCWKMEFQERGAVHFHIMFFPPKNLAPGRWNLNDEKRLEWLRMKVSTAWNEIIGKADDFEPVRSKNGKIFGNMSLYSGTQVAPVHSWEMATGYLYEYFKKEMKKDSEQFFENGERLQTGRFWGFSNNFDFREFYKGETDITEIEKVKNSLKTVSRIAYKEFLGRMREKAKRVKGKRLPEPQKRAIFNKMMNTVKKQKRRFLINIEKIERGAAIQVEVAKEQVYQELKEPD